MAFQKGQSGNPSGRPKITLSTGESLTELARKHTATALKRLVNIVDDEAAPHSAQVTAATAILDRGWGRPAQSLTLAGDADHPLQVRTDFSVLTDEQVRAIASVRLIEAN